MSRLGDGLGPGGGGGGEGGEVQPGEVPGPGGPGSRARRGQVTCEARLVDHVPCVCQGGVRAGRTGL